MLDTAHIAKPDFNKAGEGLLINAQELIAAGYFEAAKAVLEHFLQPGPWRLKKYGKLVPHVERLLPLVCFLCNAAMPKVGAREAMSAEAVSKWAAKLTADLLLTQKLHPHRQSVAVGAGWSIEMLDALITMPASEAKTDAFEEFCDHAEIVLKVRLVASLAAASPHSIATREQALAWVEKTVGGKAKPNFAKIDIHKLSEMMSILEPILMDDAAASISDARICDALIHYRQRESGAQPHIDDECRPLFCILLTLSLEHNDMVTAANAAIALASTPRGMVQLLDAAVSTRVAALLRTHCVAASLQIDAATVSQYLATLSTRAAPLMAPLTAEEMPVEPLFTDTLKGFVAIFQRTIFAKKKFIALPIADTTQTAYGVACHPSEARALWEVAVGLVPQTRRWPVVTTCWRSDNKTAAALLDEDLFDRHYFAQEAARDDISPAAFIADAKNIDLDAALLAAENALVENQKHHDFDDSIAWGLKTTEDYIECAPTAEDVANARVDGRPIQTYYALERWLLDWELAHGLQDAGAEARPDFFEPKTTFLVFLPTPNSWEVLAYMAFSERDPIRTETAIALLKRWHEQYGAKLYGHFGSTLEFFTETAPTTIDAAWQLAKEHELLASATLDELRICLRHYAVALRQTKVWCLEEII